MGIPVINEKYIYKSLIIWPSPKSRIENRRQPTI